LTNYLRNFQFRLSGPLIAALAISLLPSRTIAAQAGSKDSAGIHITVTTIGAATGALRLSAAPTLDLGGTQASAEFEFNRIRDVVRLHNGTIVVVNGGNQQLRFFDAHGAFLRAAGRKGAGPGEFQNPSHILKLPGDTLMVSDDFARRIVLFSPGGDHLRTEVLVSPPGRREPIIVDALPNRTLIAGSIDITTLPPRADPYYLTQHLFLYGLDGKPQSDVGSFTDRESFVQHTVPERGGTAYWDLAFGRQTTVAARGGGILVGDGSTFELRGYTRAGALREIIRSPVTPEVLTATERDAYRRDELKDVKPQDRAIDEKMLDEMPYPKNIPAFRRFLVADDGRLWVQRYPHVGELSDRWIVLDAKGMYLDQLVTPKGFRLFRAGADYALGVYRDEDDVEHVQLYPLSLRSKGVH
jgi:6-bladed beta-propeller protein